MVSFRVGNDIVSDLRLGATPVQRLYVGSTVVWQRPAVYTDDFNRSNGSPGPNWATGGTRPATIRNQSIGCGDIGNSDGAYEGWARFVSPLNSDNQIVSASLVSSPNSQITALVCRGNSDLTTCIMAEATSGKAAISTVIDNTRTERASASVSWSSGQVMAVRVVNGAYQLLRNGAMVVSWTDSGGVIPAGTRYPGVRLGGARSFFSNTYSAQLDNWTAQDILT